MADQAVATGYLRLVPTTDGIQGALGNQFGGLGGHAAKKFGAGFLPVLGGFLAAAGGAMLAREVKDFVSAGIKDLARIETIQAQTIAVIRSTGAAAGVSASEVNLLADSLERTTATESETIREGANLLLTFKNIRNAAGAGNDVFNQSVAAMVDLSRAMGTDTSGAAIQLGKALNDPVAGISALTRVGITFTDEQKELIRALVESGDLLGAQKIILQELTSQFGGSGAAYADTFAGKLDLVKTSAGNLRERLLEGLMPTFEGFLDVADRVLKGIDESTAFQGIIDKINTLGTDSAGDLERVVGLIERLAAADQLNGESLLSGLVEIFPQLQPLLSIAETLEPIMPTIAQAMDDFFKALSEEDTQKALTTLVQEVLPALVDLFLALTPLIPPLAGFITSVLVPAVTGLSDELEVAIGFFTVLSDTIASGGDLRKNLFDFISDLAKSGNGFAQNIMSTAVFWVNALRTLANGWIGAINAVIGAMENLVNSWGQIAGVRVSFNRIPQLPMVSLAPPQKRGMSAQIPGLAEGGTITRAGWAMVGEAGPELINFNAGAQVRPLEDSLLPMAGFPSTVTLLDRDGSLLGHMAVMVDQYDEQQRTARAMGSRGY